MTKRYFLNALLTTSTAFLFVLNFSFVHAAATQFSVPKETAEKIKKAKPKTSVYVIGMKGDPVVSYIGNVSGLKATQPRSGERINRKSREVQEYAKHLEEKHDHALRSVFASHRKLYDYRYSFNGFAAELTELQAKALATRSDIAFVQADSKRYPVTDNTPSFLELMEDDGLWEELGGPRNAGEDVIIGVIDTGIWPEHPSFSDQSDYANRRGKRGKSRRAYGPPPAHWNGICQAGEQWSATDCNNKLIGARYFLEGFGQQGIIKDDYKSARDAEGHGTHTASTAGGNYKIPATIFDTNFGSVSGMAPRARIAVYKACWNNEGCLVSDLAAAIDQAVADGVDVINYSIGSDSPDLVSPDAIAFLNAANNGVFVATSAGNSGPSAQSIGSPATVPWVTTVGASTQNRTFLGSVTLGNNDVYSGESVTSGTASLALIDAEDAGSELCLPGELIPEMVSGKIVLCLRGEIARVDKSLAVSQAGGAGMILYNADDSQTQVTDNHHVPTVHINNSNGILIKEYIDTAAETATAQIAGGEFTKIEAPTMADFSSRGPNGGALDLIKPDVTAPGVNILAGNSPTPFIGAPGQLFQAISGTSMSSPHVAGIGALLTQAYPNWSPAMIKSALMTTAYQNVKNHDGFTMATPFDFGAGHIKPNSALEPGLVYDAGIVDYLGFLCGSTDAVNPDVCQLLAFFEVPFDPSDLNLPSIGIHQLAGRQTIVRRITNVDDDDDSYRVSVDLPGIDVEVNPSELELEEGEMANIEITFTNVSAPTDAWTFGSLTWSNGENSVRSPIALRPVMLAATNEISGSGVSGSASFPIQFGYSGELATQPHGLVPAQTQTDIVIDDPDNDINIALNTGIGITLHTIVIPEGTAHARISLFDDKTDGEDDLDLYVFGPDTSGFPFAGGSGSGTSAEEVNIESPEPGIYIVIVHGWQTDGPDANYTLYAWTLSSNDEGNMSVTAPTSAQIGESDEILVDWDGLTADTRYMGSVTYHDAASPLDYFDRLIGSTVIRINTD
ncbi:S8 family peptidase [Kaarinaea lacus]